MGRVAPPNLAGGQITPAPIAQGATAAAPRESRACAACVRVCPRAGLPRAAGEGAGRPEREGCILLLPIRLRDF